MFPSWGYSIKAWNRPLPHLRMRVHCSFGRRFASYICLLFINSRGLLTTASGSTRRSWRDGRWIDGDGRTRREGSPAVHDGSHLSSDTAIWIIGDNHTISYVVDQLQSPVRTLCNSEDLGMRTHANRKGYLYVILAGPKGILLYRTRLPQSDRVGIGRQLWRWAYQNRTAQNFLQSITDSLEPSKTGANVRRFCRNHHLLPCKRGL